MKRRSSFILTSSPLLLLVALFATTRSDADFEVPDKPAQFKAIGSTTGLPAEQRRAFSDDGSFAPIAKPGAADWLANHREPGQTFRQFMESRRNRPDAARRKIYLRPIGKFVKGESPSLGKLCDYTAAFFGLEVALLPALDLDKLPVKTRLNSGKQQALSTDILDVLRKFLPKDAFCMVAVTMVDLYPEESWNYVFGQASLRDRVGVFSFARYDPAFFGGKRGDGWRTTMLRRSCKVLAHETGHMFGIRHCIFFDCTMNGANNLPESDAQSMHLCPSCLRKLHNSVRFDLGKRYSALAKFFKAESLDEEAKWVVERLKRIDAK